MASLAHRRFQVTLELLGNYTTLFSWRFMVPQLDTWHGLPTSTDTLHFYDIGKHVQLIDFRI